MKKFLAIILGALFVMSFAASAFAIHAEIPSETQAIVAAGSTQITLGGEIRTRGWYQKNIVAGAPTASPSGAWYDERVRLSIDAKVSPEVQGYVQLESGAASGSGATALTANQQDLVTWGNFNSKLGGMNILQAWILYKNTSLFGFGSGLKIGHMPLALGEKQFFDHTKFGDDAIVFFIDPTKELHAGLLTIKFAEGATTNNHDDIDGYVGLFTYKLDPKNTIGANYTYLNGNLGVGAGPGLKMSDVGLHANGNVSGLGYKAEVDFQFGDISESVKAKGYGAMVGLSYTVDPATIRASAALGSGNKADSTDMKEFVTFLDNGVRSGLIGDPHYTLVYEYRVNATSGRRYSGLANTTYLNIGADFTPVKDLKTSLDAFFLRATESTGSAHGSKNAGWEVDGKVVYNMAKNLVYQVDAGYFKAGNFYEDKKGATVLRHQITLNF
ncbi:MAG: alginate export family protein [Thermodesulfovibrionales bacterium]